MNNSKQHVYLIPGLGADKRVFQHLEFPNCELHHIPWLTIDEDDTMASYARKLATLITEKNAIIVGMSLGGMLAMEMAKFLDYDKVILISSAKTRKELGKQLTNPVTSFFYNHITPNMLYEGAQKLKIAMGAQTQEEKDLLNQIIEQTTPEFLYRAAGMIIKWQNDVVAQNVYHIHGTNDKVIPFKSLENVIEIEGGSHFMAIQNYKTINLHIAQILGV